MFIADSTRWPTNPLHLRKRRRFGLDTFLHRTFAGKLLPLPVGKIGMAIFWHYWKGEGSQPDEGYQGCTDGLLRSQWLHRRRLTLI